MGSRSGRKFGYREKVMMFSQLQVLLHSGLSFSRAFSLLIDSAGTVEKELYSRVFSQVVAGRELWWSLEQDGNFTALDCSIVRIGEQTGRLTDALAFLTAYYRGREEQKRMVRSALSYPIIILCIAVAVLSFMLLVVVPMFEQVYARMGGELPAVTRKMITVAGNAPVILSVICAGIVICLLIRRCYGTTDAYLCLVSGLVMRMPIAGDLVRKYQVARFSRVMHLLVSSQIHLPHALNLLKGIINFYPYKKSLDSVCRAVEKGSGLADALDEYESLFGKRFLVLMRVGEETNSLDKALLSQSLELDRELKYAIGQLNNVLEPFLILAIGVVVAFVLIAMYMPMFKLGMVVR